MKSFTYADANANFNDPVSGAICFDRKQGKLAEQSRFNYVTIFGSPYTVEMREGMTYCARDGRLSRESLENRVNGAVTPNESFVLPNLSYDALGNVTSESYPQCTHVACTAVSPRTVTNAYTSGYLTSVGLAGAPQQYATSITYHPNGLVNQVVHANTPSFPSTWLTDTYALDPFGMNRPAAITTTTSGGVQRWATGAYGYDGAGNIKSMGTHTFAYDKVSRLTAANLYLEPTSSTSLRFQTFSYDAFGNLQSIAGSSARSTPTSSSTNRLTGTTVTYDAQGNVTAWNGSQYEYDPFNLMWHYKTATAGDEWVYLYTADDERVWSYKADNTSLWTLRAPGANVLREYTTNGTWSVQSDYVYREGLLLAAETASGLRHFHLDHLGTPRLVTNGTGLQAAYHVYYPYGEEATAFNQDTIRAKFTGHERDLGNPGGSGDDLDYMHARFCSPLTGRFSSVDPKNRYRATTTPQRWNRYGYAAGNPLKYLDPDGRELAVGIGSPAAALTAARLMVPATQRQAITLRSDSSGRASFAIDNSTRSKDINFKSLQRIINSPGRVELNIASPETKLNFQTRDGSIAPAGQFGDINKKGLTLPSAGTRTGSDSAFSSTRGVTQVFINATLSSQAQAPVMAAEFGAHVLPALLGRGSSIPDDAEHTAAEAPFIAAAKENAKQ